MSTFCPPAASGEPEMKSRKGYDATARRSRGSAGNCTFGPVSAANANRGHTEVAAAAIADCARKCLRVVCGKTRRVYQIEAGM